MKALRFAKYGPPSVLSLEDVGTPTPKPGEALVEVHAAAINPSDVKNVAGAFDATLPRTPGRDYAGVVVEGDGWKGREVWGSGEGLGVARDGTHAQYLVVPSDWLSQKPSNLTMEQASTAGVPFLAAWSALVDAADIRQGETVLITAGGTREPIDAVRFLGNRSSGKMGYALASAAVRRGARVILVSAPTALDAPAGCEVVCVNTALEMQTAVLKALPEATVVIKAAAVADFRVRNSVAGKLERSGPLTLGLEPTEDIVRKVVEARRPGTLVIAFAAEMGEDLTRAREKLMRKGADAIVVNDVSGDGIGFDSDRNAATFLTGSQSVSLPETTKVELADDILDQVLPLLTAHRKQDVSQFVIC